MLKGLSFFLQRKSFLESNDFLKTQERDNKKLTSPFY
jgi:hypothetical protein